MACHGRCVKERKKWKTLESWSKAFCFVALANYLLLFGFTTWSMVRNATFGDYPALTLRLIFFVIIGFQVAHSWFGLVHDNIYELAATMLAQVFISIYLVGILLQAQRPWSFFHYALMCYGTIFFALYIVFVYPLHREFSWIFFRKAGADPDFRRKYRRFLRFQAILKIQLMGMIVNSLVIGAIPLTFSWSWFLTFDFAIVVASLLLYVLGRTGFQKEKLHYVFSFWVLQLMVPAYLIYCFFVDLTGYLFLFYGSGLVLFVIQILVIVTSVMLYQHFGEGIKNIRAHLKKQLRESKVPGSARASRSEFKGLSTAGRESDSEPEDFEEEEEEEKHQTEEMFQEIFQNTLERAHHVGSVEDQTYQILLGDSTGYTTTVN